MIVGLLNTGHEDITRPGVISSTQSGKTGMDSPVSALTSGRGKQRVNWTEFFNKWEKYDWTLPRLMDFIGVTFLV